VPGVSPQHVFESSGRTRIGQPVRSQQSSGRSVDFQLARRGLYGPEELRRIDAPKANEQSDANGIPTKVASGSHGWLGASSVEVLNHSMAKLESSAGRKPIARVRVFW
jgi:hypothetical protein